MKLILVRYGDPYYANDCLIPLGLAQTNLESTVKQTGTFKN